MVQKYVSRLPKEIPAGKILCHNHVTPAHPIYENGFRVWLDDPSDHYERCNCGWENGIEHYKGKTEGPTVQEAIANYLKPNMKKKLPAKKAVKFVKKKGMVKAQSRPYTPPAAAKKKAAKKTVKKAAKKKKS